MSSTDLIVSLVNASLEAIHNTSNPAYDECWICFSPTPPFYEGIAMMSGPVPTNDTAGLLWQAPLREALPLVWSQDSATALLGPTCSLCDHYNRSVIRQLLSIKHFHIQKPQIILTLLAPRDLLPI